MAGNDPRFQFMLDEAANQVDVHAELHKIIEDVKAARAGTIQQAAAAVKAGDKPQPMDIGAAIIPRVLLKEHELRHVKVAVFSIRGHAVYEIALTSEKAKRTHPSKIQGILKTGLGSAFEDHPCQGWRDQWIPLIWGVWVQKALERDNAKSYFTQVVPASIDAAFENA